MSSKRINIIAVTKYTPICTSENPAEEIPPLEHCLYINFTRSTPLLTMFYEVGIIK